MAQKFYYDSVDILGSTLNDGTVSLSGTEIFADAASLTNEERAVDQSITTAITDWAENDALQFDLGSAKTVSFVAVYFNAAEADTLVLSYDDAATGNSQADNAITADFSVGWNVTEFSPASKRYWFISAKTAGGLVGITEVILGAYLEFSINPDIGISEQEIFGTAVNRSAGGVEYAVKKHNPISTWTLNFANISSTFKTNLQSMEAEVQDYKKFLWYDETNYHYVRLESPIKYTEVAYQRYSASISLREQLS